MGKELNCFLTLYYLKFNFKFSFSLMNVYVKKKTKLWRVEKRLHGLNKLRMPLKRHRKNK